MGIQERISADAGCRGEDKERKALRRSVISLAAEIAFLVVTLTLLFAFALGITVQHGNDMYPAVRDGDVILFYRTGSLINTDACVYVSGGELHTGRVAACSGTEISATSDMQLTFDGIYLPASPDNGIYDRTYAAEGQPLPVTVKDGYYFILGDNRNAARDSRIYGQISRRNIKGRIIAILRHRQI